MKVLEYENNKVSPVKYALSINLSVTSLDDLKSQFREVKEAIINWKAHRKDDSELILLSLEANEELHGELEEFVNLVYSGEKQLSPILSELSFKVQLFNKEGNGYEYTL